LDDIEKQLAISIVYKLITKQEKNK